MDPRQKHEYLESGQICLKITEGEGNGDESDKHIQPWTRVSLQVCS